MNLKSIVFVSALACASAAMADEAIRFVPENYPIGMLNQGDTKHIVLKGANTTNQEIVLENVFGQGNGMSNFKFPNKIPAKGTVTIEFDFSSAEMEGQINPVVVLVDTTGKPYLANMDGVVKVPFVFSEKLFDAGYYAKALTTKGLTREGWELKQKSIRKIVSFKSKKYPKATPDVLIVGYWK